MFANEQELFSPKKLSKKIDEHKKFPFPFEFVKGSVY